MSVDVEEPKVEDSNYTTRIGRMIHHRHLEPNGNHIFVFVFGLLDSYVIYNKNCAT